MMKEKIKAIEVNLRMLLRRGRGVGYWVIKLRGY